MYMHHVYHVITVWSSVPNSVVTAPCAHLFKRCLFAVNISKFNTWDVFFSVCLPRLEQQPCKI